MMDPAMQQGVPDDEPTQPSQRLVYGGRYAAEGELGRGGMGRVLRARDLKLDRAVAIKVMPAGLHTDAQRSRFEREARAAGALSHPNILDVHDVGEQNGEPYIVTELLEGQSLGVLLKKGPLAADQVLDFARQLASGLAAAHGKGIVHRDLKPGNLFVTEEGRLKILDFGIAKMAESSPPAVSTGTGTVLGTPAYMSPEQVCGRPVDARSDVFSFGAVLQEMLSGRPPFERANSMATGFAILNDAPAALPSSALARVVARCLEKMPQARYRDGGELLEDLDAVARGQRSAAGRRLRRRVAVVAALGLFATVAVAAVVRRAVQARHPVAGPPSIAVLPFADMSAGKDQEYLADGIAEEILNTLAHVRGLRVTGRASSFYFKGKQEELPKIASKLRATTLLDGSVRRSGNRIRITAVLINAADGYHIWSKEYDRELTDLFKVQGEVATDIVEVLKAKLLPAASLSVNLHPARNPEAYRAFLLGRALFLYQTEEGARRAREALEKAVALEPSYALAWDYLAMLRAMNAVPQRGSNARNAAPQETMARAKEAVDAAEKAIAADPEDALAYSTRAWIRALGLWDWKGARDDLHRSMQLAPDDATVQQMAAGVLPKLGRLKEAISLLRKVSETDPLNVYAWSVLGAYLMFDGQFDAAREALRRSLEISPDNFFAGGYLADLDLLEGRLHEALAGFHEQRHDAVRLTGVAMAEHSLGHARQAESALLALEALDRGAHAFDVARVRAWRGEREAAFAWLERAVDQHDLDLRNVAVDPFLRGVRDDYRYAELLKKMKFPLD